MTAGRPEIHTKELEEHICDRLASGEAIRTITSEKGMPCWKTVRDWFKTKEGFQARYSQAKMEGIEYILSDNRKKALDTYERSKEGKGKVGLEETHALKLLMHDAHWSASKLVPKVWPLLLNIAMSQDDKPAIHSSAHTLCRTVACTICSNQN